MLDVLWVQRCVCCPVSCACESAVAEVQLARLASGLRAEMAGPPPLLPASAAGPAPPALASP